MAFCNGCGAPLAENARFCIKCGEEVFAENEDITVSNTVNKTSRNGFSTGGG